MLDVPFAYSSNGDGFAEHDFLTGKERQFGLDEFPTEEELLARYKSLCCTPHQSALLTASPKGEAFLHTFRPVVSSTPSRIFIF